MIRLKRRWAKQSIQEVGQRMVGVSFFKGEENLVFSIIELGFLKMYLRNTGLYGIETVQLKISSAFEICRRITLENEHIEKILAGLLLHYDRISRGT